MLTGMPLIRPWEPLVAIQPLSEKFFVSTTSVVSLPVAAGVAVPELEVLRDPLPAVDGDEADVVDHLGVDDHVLRRLRDPVVVVVAGRKQVPGDAARDAAVPDAHVLVRVEHLHQVVGAHLLRLGPHRDAAGRRIDDQGGPPAADDPGAQLEPVQVVGADVLAGFRLLCGLVGAILDHGLTSGLRLGDLFLGEEGLVAHLDGPFEGRERGVRPQSLEVGMTPGKCAASASPSAARAGAPARAAARARAIIVRLIIDDSFVCAFGCARRYQVGRRLSPRSSAPAPVASARRSGPPARSRNGPCRRSYRPFSSGGWSWR